MKYPFLIPNSPKLSESRDLLTEIELSGLFTNYGPKNSQLEAEFASLFESPGQTCLTVCNATLGLIVAIRLLLEQSKRQGSLCLMPSFTFAATAHAASWNGLNPLFCDVDPKDWTMDKQQIKSLLKKHGDEVALIMPYATFGTNLDLSWYEQLSEKTGVPVLIDAAASLGSKEIDGSQAGAKSNLLQVFSMHVTKSFATAEGGLIYCKNQNVIEKLRSMCNFGFSSDRQVHSIGLNAKMPEIIAALALLKLKDLKNIIAKRQQLYNLYKEGLKGFEFQQHLGQPISQFLPVLMPLSLRPRRKEFINLMQKCGVDLRTYFSPCLHQQSYFKKEYLANSLHTTELLGSAIVNFPLYDLMEPESVTKIIEITDACLKDLQKNESKNYNPQEIFT